MIRTYTGALEMLYDKTVHLTIKFNPTHGDLLQIALAFLPDVQVYIQLDYE